MNDIMKIVVLCAMYVAGSTVSMIVSDCSDFDEDNRIQFGHAVGFAMGLVTAVLLLKVF